MSSYIKSKKAKKDWKSMGFGKSSEKEEEMEKDSGEGMFSKLKKMVSGPTAAEVATEQLEKRKKKGK